MCLDHIMMNMRLNMIRLKPILIPLSSISTRVSGTCFYTVYIMYPLCVWSTALVIVMKEIGTCMIT